MPKPNVVRYCQKHDVQLFYESKMDCMGRETFQYRCAMCKHEYYENNAEKIKQRNKKNSAKNQAAYRKRLKSEAIEAYSSTFCCAICGESSFKLLVVVDTNGSGKSHAWLKQNGWPTGHKVMCRRCARTAQKTSEI